MRLHCFAFAYLLQRKPQADAPEEYEYEAVEVRDHRFEGKKVKFELLYVSSSAEFRDYTLWATIEEALLDLMDDDDKSMVVEYSRKHEDPCVNRKLLEAITKTIDRTKHKALKEKYPRAYYAPKQTVDIPNEHGSKCKHTHDNPLDKCEFEEVFYTDYFTTQNKTLGFLAGAKCKKCKEVIAGDKRPNRDRPVYVCKTLMRQRDNNCGCMHVGIWCNLCGINSATTRRRRTNVRQGLFSYTGLVDPAAISITIQDNSNGNRQVMDRITLYS